MNGYLFVRILIAVFSVLLIFALLGPVSRTLGFPLTGDPLTIVRICIGGIALFYIVTGKPA